MSKITGININKYIRTFLIGCDELIEICPAKNIKPLILPPSTLFPFISYVHGDIIPQYTKDGQCEDLTDVLIACVSDDYETSISLAEIVRNLLEEKCYEDDDVMIPEIRIKAISEDYIDNAYVQMVTFDFKIITK